MKTTLINGTFLKEPAQIAGLDLAKGAVGQAVAYGELQPDGTYKVVFCDYGLNVNQSELAQEVKESGK